VTLLDAYALVALLADEPAAEDVHELLLEGQVAISAVNLAESLDVARRTYRVTEADISSDLDPLIARRALAVIAARESTARRAASLRHAHYRRRGLEISLADCFLVASAEPGDRIATADPGVIEVGRREGIELIPLPDSTGRRRRP
jgi:PIN domain nuclease of toxin-antitoxin system